MNTVYFKVNLTTIDINAFNRKVDTIHLIHIRCKKSDLLLSFESAELQIFLLFSFVEPE